MPDASHPPIPRMPLSRERVLRTALELADAGGLAALSMRKIGSALGVEAMSLYNHVANKEDVLEGITDLVAGEFSVPDIGGDWRAAMRARALAAHAVLLRHPWATQRLVSAVTVGPHMLRYVNATLGCLREAGFSYALADQAWNALDSHLYGFTLQELQFPFEPGTYAEVAQAYLPQLPAADYPYLHELTALVATGKHPGAQDFSFGLELLLEGLQRLLEEGAA